MKEKERLREATELLKLLTESVDFLTDHWHGAVKVNGKKLVKRTNEFLKNIKYER